MSRHIGRRPKTEDLSDAIARARARLKEDRRPVEREKRLDEAGRTAQERVAEHDDDILESVFRAKQRKAH